MASCELLGTIDTTNRLNRLLGTPGLARLAVAFWGLAAGVSTMFSAVFSAMRAASVALAGCRGLFGRHRTFRRRAFRAGLATRPSPLARYDLGIRSVAAGAAFIAAAAFLVDGAQAPRSASSSGTPRCP